MASSYAAIKGSISAAPSAKYFGVPLGRSKQVLRSHGTTVNPFQPGLASEIFEEHDYLWASEQTDCSGDEPYRNVELPLEEQWYQAELPLENQRDLEQRLRNEIKKFERNSRKMMIFALQWYYLMEDVEDNEQVEKMFKDMQMVRKLTGSDKV